MTKEPNTPVAGLLNPILRAEGALVLAAASLGYAQTGSGWGLFALLFLAPDLFMLGYLHGSRIGALVYNIGHSYLTPALLAAGGWLAGAPVALAVALIWVAHIGFDRMLGYGLKYGGGFKLTHLSRG
jgi:Domain of unknown function (DUF4260)